MHPLGCASGLPHAAIFLNISVTICVSTLIHSSCTISPWKHSEDRPCGEAESCFLLPWGSASLFVTAGGQESPRPPLRLRGPYASFKAQDLIVAWASWLPLMRTSFLPRCHFGLLEEGIPRSQPQAFQLQRMACQLQKGVPVSGERSWACRSRCHFMGMSTPQIQCQ